MNCLTPTILEGSSEPKFGKKSPLSFLLFSFFHKKKMSSVSVEPSQNILNNNDENDDQEELCANLTKRCSIDIHGQAVSNDILVALLDRASEMKQLAQRNAQFYEAIEHYITETQGDAAWQRFQDIVYKPREKLPDRPWIHQISQYLAHNPVFLSKFKESVGYEDEEEEAAFRHAVHVSPPHKLTSSTSTGSMNTMGSSGRRRSRRLSSVSFGEPLDFNDSDSILEEEAPKVPEGMFANEEQFYHQHVRRRRSSYHSIQSEPHPTFVDSKIDEVDEAQIEYDKTDDVDESDHLSDLLDSSDDEQAPDQLREKNTEAGYSAPKHKGPSKQSDMHLIKLRDYSDFQANLVYSHPQYFRKAKQLLSLAPSSRHFSATIRRNSILEDAMPPSPVTEMDEPRLQTCSEANDDNSEGNLIHLICCTRRQQPDDIAWLNGVMDSLAGWPELVDGLHEIINDSLED